VFATSLREYLKSMGMTVKGLKDNYTAEWAISLPCDEVTDVDLNDIHDPTLNPKREIITESGSEGKFTASSHAF
jgi:hypothetical protein